MLNISLNCYHCCSNYLRLNAILLFYAFIHCFLKLYWLTYAGSPILVVLDDGVANKTHHVCLLWLTNSHIC